MRIWSRVMQFELNLSVGVQLCLNLGTTHGPPYLAKSTCTRKLHYPNSRGVCTKPTGGYRTQPTAQLDRIETVSVNKWIKNWYPGNLVLILSKNISKNITMNSPDGLFFVIFLIYSLIYSLQDSRDINL